MKSCLDCKFLAKVDSGYSNWTVTETTIHCMKNHFDPTEESYSWDYETRQAEFFKRAENCDDFKEALICQVGFDVDGDVTIEDFADDPEVYDAAKEYFGDGRTNS